MSSYDEIERAEPAYLTGLITGGAGLLALLAANFSLPHSAGVAVGMTVSQALLTRPTVVSPKTLGGLFGSADPSGVLAEVIGAAHATPRPDEPVAAVGGLVFVVGFLAQILTGVSMTAAFASALGLAGVQTVATRSRVYSPLTAKAIVANRAKANLGGGSETSSANTPASVAAS
ncbi:MAG TPA: hypothetical protein VJ204_02470 [Solirubrobacterales bacterium]|nr:hypothetical protein [Solirubrobacterales bacterium]